MTELSIDFGGYQDHTINGGLDQLSIGYQELFSPLIKSIQELNTKLKLQKTEREKIEKEKIEPLINIILELETEISILNNNL